MDEEDSGGRGSDLALPEVLEVGPYRIVAALGRGGMGTVYLAEQSEPVRRTVALKVLNSGRITDRGIARMEAERQALALMNHPCIATVYDAGTTTDGLPCFAMEVVDGKPLITYCDENRLSTEVRLELFVQICDAVQHAHQKMIIHRDIKPSNVMVAVEDGRPVPKLIDFGIAKCLEGPLVDNTSLVTHEGLPVGTPLYMSPEQIEGELIDLDARVDVYALGMLLYELLAGAQPFEAGEAEAMQVMLRVLKDDFPRPSDRFSELEVDRQGKIAAGRSTDVRTLKRELSGDPDWIIMRAVEKERRLRYGSVLELKEDVVRYLRSEEVLARPPAVSYRVKRFVRRHRTTVAAALIVFLTLLGGLAVSTASMVRATRARDAAQQAEQRANATVDYLRKVLGAVDPGIDGRQVRVVDLLAKASEMITSDLSDQPGVEAAVRKTIGLTLLELGVFEGSAEQLERTVAIQVELLGEEHPETLHSINAEGRILYKLGQYEPAAAIHRVVYEKQRQLLGEENSTTLWTMYHLAKALDKNGSWDEAERLYRENVEIRTRVLGSRHPDTLVAINSMSLFLGVAGELGEAEALQIENLETLRRDAGEQHPDTLRARANLVEIFNMQDRFAEAEALSRETMRVQTEVLGPEHPESLGTAAQLATALREQGRFRDAEALDRRVLALRRVRLGASHPDTLSSQVSIALDLLQQGELEEAESLLRQSLRTADAVLPQNCWRTALYSAELGRCLVTAGRFDEAEKLLLQSQSTLKGRRHRAAGRVLEQLVALYEGWGKEPEAAHYRSML